jgi:hypothetical protein
VVLLYSMDHNGLDLPNADASLQGMVKLLDSMKDSHHLLPERVLDSDAKGKAAGLMDSALVIIGPNTRSCNGGVDAAIKGLAVPVMVSKDCTDFMSLGKVGATDPPRDDKIVLVKGDHPLAAALQPGTLTVLTTPTQQRIVFFTGLGAEAIKIAASPRGAASNEWSIFGYEKGATMAGGFKAPAKRIGFFWHRPADATPEGQKLFKAAVEWAIRP